MFWICSTGRFCHSDDEAAVLNSAQVWPKTQECKLKMHSACTWLFRAKAQLAPAKTWIKLGAAFPRTSPETMHWRCLNSCACMLWLRQTGFGLLCAEHIRFCCSLKPWLPINHHLACWSHQTSLDHIRGDIVWKTTAQLTIHKASQWSHHSKIPGWDYQQTASGGFLRVQLGPYRGNHVGANTWFCERKFAWVPGEILLMCWKTKSSARRRNCRWCVISPDSDQQGTMQAKILASVTQCSRQSIEPHLMEGVGGMADQLCRCGASESRVNLPIQQKTVHLARDHSAI